MTTSSPIGQAILSAQDVSKRFGAQAVLDGISLTVHEGDRIGLIGSNGTGKSTLLHILAGVDNPDAGDVIRRQGLRTALLSQQSAAPPESTVREVLQGAVQSVRRLIDQYHETMDQFSHAPENAVLAEEVEHLQHQLEVSDAWNLEQDVKRVRVALNLPEDDRVIGSLSGGEQRRVDLAATLIQRPDVLLLDEPTNHIDVASVEWIEGFLAQYSGSCILVTHDRYFLSRISNRIVELAFAEVTSYPGNYEDFLGLKARRMEHEARAEDVRQGTLRRELAWLRRGPKARSTKQKARIDRFNELANQDGPNQQRKVTFELIPAKRLSKRILEAENVGKGFDGKALFTDFSFILQRGMRVGFVGPNGCGKTTLLRTLMGRETPDSGSVYIGDATEFVYVDQTHETVDPATTVLKYFSNDANEIDIGERRVHVPAYLERFLFDRGTIRMPMGRLSGGERNRLDIAKKLIAGGNILVLDEPTNDLDLTTLRVLEEVIEQYTGCALIVSHDRYFLNRLCTHVVVFEEDGDVVVVAGNYDDYLNYRKERLAKAPPAAGPKKSAQRPASKSRSRKLTWNEKRELETMEAVIEQADAEVERLESTVNEADFYSRGHTDVQEVLDALAAAKGEVEHLYARWEDLEAIANAAT
jgi:ATP-binding cassette subfamily F protein uup